MEKPAWQISLPIFRNTVILKQLGLAIGIPFGLVALIINRLTIALGLLSAQAVTVGSGMLAQSGQEVFIPWKRVSKVKYKRKSHTILLRAGPMEQMALFCTADNYPQVERELMRRTVHLAVNADGTVP